MRQRHGALAVSPVGQHLLAAYVVPSAGRGVRRQVPPSIGGILHCQKGGRGTVGEGIVTHLMPAPPQGLAVNGDAAPEDCDEGPVPVVRGPCVISWEPVVFSHPERGIKQ
jgi:hypothetical protein